MLLALFCVTKLNFIDKKKIVLNIFRNRKIKKLTVEQCKLTQYHEN